MIDDRTVYHLLDQLACEVLRRMMHDGKTLEEIDDDLVFLRKVDRSALYERIVERFLVDMDEEEAEARAIVAHLRTLKRRKRPQPTHPPAPIIPFLH